MGAISLPWQAAPKPPVPVDHPSQPDQPTTPVSKLPRFPPAQRQQQQQHLQQQMQQQQTSSTTTTAASAADKSTDRNRLRTAPAAIAADEQDHLCVEMAAGRKRVYRSIEGTEQGQRWEGFDMVEGHHTAKEGFRSLVHSYLLPQGFPHSVAPEYATYM
ncbi:MAG: hypothetical protein WDW38_002773 [Sanguina aurantia]